MIREGLPAWAVVDDIEEFDALALGDARRDMARSGSIGGRSLGSVCAPSPTRDVVSVESIKANLGRTIIELRREIRELRHEGALLRLALDAARSERAEARRRAAVAMRDSSWQRRRNISKEVRERIRAEQIVQGCGHLRAGDVTTISVPAFLAISNRPGRQSLPMRVESVSGPSDNKLVRFVVL